MHLQCSHQNELQCKPSKYHLESTAGESKFKDMLQQLDRMILDKQEEMNETKELREDKS